MDIYRGYRFRAAIISHCVWLYFRFCLSFRDVQEMMLERGMQVSHEAIRLWTLKLGAEYAHACGGALVTTAPRGILTRYSAGSMASWCIYGAPWIRMARPSTSWCRSDAT